MHRLIILIFSLLLYSSNGFSCDCDWEYSYTSEFYHCDVILSGTVLNVFAKTKDSYKIELKINKIFKGDSISEFLVNSTPENYVVVENGDTLIYMSDCDIYLRVGEDWLIYADQRIDGSYGFGFCSATKKKDEVDKTEFDFLNYNNNLAITDNSRFYTSKELDNPELTSLSIRGCLLSFNHFIVNGLKKEEFELNIKIDKYGYVVLDALKNEDCENVIKEIKEYEPFIPGTAEGEIVNSEYKMIIKKKITTLQ